MNHSLNSHAALMEKAKISAAWLFSTVLITSPASEKMCIRDSSKAPAIFDPLKLRAINAEYIRRLSPEEFQKKAEPWIDSAVHSPRCV